jgi:beta-exotoxin I transport system permease protein
MRGPLSLLAHSLKRARTLLLAMGVLLGVFQVLLIVVARAIESSGSFEQMSAMMPPFVRELLGPSFASFMSFGGIVCLGYFHLAVMGSLVALVIALGTVPTSEVESGFIDLILARPLRRHWIITRSVVVILISTTALLLMMMAATWAGLSMLAPQGAAWPPLSLILSLVINLGALLLCWGGVAMAIGAASRRRSVAGAITGLLALATFLLDYVARIWQPAGAVWWLSPFRYYSPFELLMGKALPAGNVIILIGVAVLGFALAYVFFSRRDISH